MASCITKEEILLLILSLLFDTSIAIVILHYFAHTLALSFYIVLYIYILYIVYIIIVILHYFA